MSERKDEPNQERILATPERARGHAEQKGEHEPASAEKREQTRQEQLETARHNVEQESAHVEKPSDNNQDEPVRITPTDKKRAYRMSLSRIQSRLPGPSKHFSRAIHNPVVENVSETIGKTIARPSGILGGSLAATLGLGVMLFFARRNGFALSGSELLLFLVSGWVIGVTVEFILKKLRRR